MIFWPTSRPTPTHAYAYRRWNHPGSSVDGSVQLGFPLVQTMSAPRFPQFTLVRTPVLAQAHQVERGAAVASSAGAPRASRQVPGQCSNGVPACRDTAATKGPRALGAWGQERSTPCSVLEGCRTRPERALKAPDPWWLTPGQRAWRAAAAARGAGAVRAPSARRVGCLIFKQSRAATRAEIFPFPGSNTPYESQD